MPSTRIRLSPGDSNGVLSTLMERQHVRPHEPVGAALDNLVRRGVCQAAVDRTTEWLDVNRQMSLGRMRRTELAQLARSVSRMWLVGARTRDAQASST